MIDNAFKFNWSEPEPNSPELQRALYAERQMANMSGYTPLPNMQGYTPNMQMSTDVTPGVVSKNTPPTQLNQQGGFRSPTGVGMVNTGTGMDYTNREARKEELMAKYKENEDKIAQLKQEYMRLQQEGKDAVGEMERKIAANRAGIGDSSQYNAWRSREDSRAAMESARQEDQKGKLSVLKSKVNNAMRDLSYARGDKQEAAARQIYDDALAEYNKAAQAAGEPQMSPNASVSGKTVTMFDTKDFIRQHRDSKGHWDSEENKQKAYDMAHSLGDEGVALLDEIFGQKTQAKAASDTKNYKKALKAAVAHLVGNARSGQYQITVQGKQKTATVTGEGDNKKIYVDGELVDEWEVK